MPDLRSFLRDLEIDGQLTRISDELSVQYEVPAVLKAFDRGNVVYFERVKGCKHPVVGGVCGTRERICRAIKAGIGDFHSRLDEALKNPRRTEVVSEGSVMEDSGDYGMEGLPVLTHYHEEESPYITSAVIFAHSPDGVIQNASIHRLQVLDNKHLAVRIVPRHLHRLCQIAAVEGLESLDVSISIGLHPALLLSSSSPAPWGTSEVDVANHLLNGELKLIPCPNVDSYAPADAEIVLEGRILLEEEVIEGPFVDLTSTSDIQRKQHPIEIVGVMRRRDFIYQALLPAGSEHVLLMGMPQEVRVLEFARNVNPTVKAVNMTWGGRGWLHCAVSFDKFNEGDGKNVLMAVFSANPSIKHAVVVDTDIDVYDIEEVEWALATRFRGDIDLLIVPNTRVSSLDPTSDQEMGTGCKVGFDATATLSKPKRNFERARIPQSDRVERVIKKYLEQGVD